MKQEDRKKLISSLGGIVSVVAGFIGAIKDFGVSPWIWGSALVVGALMAMAPYVRDIYNVIAKCITPLFTPDISWHNDGFAYMTIEARFRDNFNKAGYKFDGLDAGGDHYAVFCKQDVMWADDITNLFPGNIADEYETKLCEQMKKYNICVKHETQYLFANTPFIFAEHYYFYHILKLFKGKKIEDPWKTVKAKSLQTTVKAKSDNRIAKLVDAYKEKGQYDVILNQSVFANSTDLSQTSARVKNTESYSRDKVSAYVINDKEKVRKYFLDKLNSRRTIHIVVDNSGIELISDLILGAYLIKEGHAGKVIYHHNVLPIFVSDAVSADFDAAIEAINTIDNDVCEEIVKLRKNKQMEFVSNAFWNMPFPFKEMPKSLLDELNKDDVGLIIIKGDLNYRRLVEDKKWRITESIDSHIDYFEKPVLILRSLKSDTLIGMDRATVKEYDREQPNWKITGDYGMIQFIEK